MRIILILCCLTPFVSVHSAVAPATEQKKTPSRTSAEILDLILRETPQPNYDGPVPSKITGRVVTQAGNDTSGVEGVSVTDGYSVAKTNALGHYTLNPDPHAVFVYITRPAGFDVAGGWYKPVATNVSFALEPAEQDEDEFIFVHVTDTHVSRDRESLLGLSRFVGEVNKLEPQPRFVVNSGDLLNLHKALLNSPESGHADFRSYVGIMNHLTMPHYNVAGDHTDSSYRLEQYSRGDHRCGKPLYWEYLGPNFFSFEYGRIHFMSVDFGYHLGQKQVPVKGKLLEYPTNQIQPMHAEWMTQDAAHRGIGTFVVTTSEADLEDHFAGFTELASKNDVRLQLVGDTHILSHKERSVPYRSGGALAGCWWNPKAGQLCPDLSPQGYLIYRVVGENLEHFYKGLGQRVSILSPRIGAPLHGQVEIDAHLVQPESGESLEYSMNNTDWTAMTEIARPFYRALFRAFVPTSALNDGLATLSVRSTTGEVQTRDYVVMNHNDPKSFTSVGSLSFTVGADTGWTKHKPPNSDAKVVFNGHVLGVLDAGGRKSYAFTIPSQFLKSANRLSFRFAKETDGMSLSSPVLNVDGKAIYDVKDQEIRQLRTAHWGNAAADWGGFIAGEAAPPDESPFHRRQNEFCFVIEPAR